MQNAVSQHIRNGADCFDFYSVTYSPFGNYPANGLVTETMQQFACFYFLAKWQNQAYRLISNGLRSSCFVLVLIALREITHLARHTCATTIALSNGISIESIAKMLGHSNIKTTQVYAKITDKKLKEDMDKLENYLKDLGINPMI